jgi:hypothetical protein
MVSKTSGAFCGLNNISGLCVNSLHRPNSIEYFPCRSICLLDLVPSNFVMNINFYCVLNLIT